MSLLMCEHDLYQVSDGVGSVLNSEVLSLTSEKGERERETVKGLGQRHYIAARLKLGH